MSHLTQTYARCRARLNVKDLKPALAVYFAAVQLLESYRTTRIAHHALAYLTDDRNTDFSFVTALLDSTYTPSTVAQVKSDCRSLLIHATHYKAVVRDWAGSKIALITHAFPCMLWEAENVWLMLDLLRFLDSDFATRQKMVSCPNADAFF